MLYPRAEIDAAIQAAAGQDAPLTAATYEQWHRDNADALAIASQAGAPGDRTVERLVCAGSLAADTRGRWTPRECLYALRLAYRERGVEVSEPIYREWRAAQDGLYSSRNAITDHWSSFTAARALAVENREEVPPEARDDNDE